MIPVPHHLGKDHEIESDDALRDLVIRVVRRVGESGTRRENRWVGDVGDVGAQFLTGTTMHGGYRIPGLHLAFGMCQYRISGCWIFLPAFLIGSGHSHLSVGLSSAPCVVLSRCTLTYSLAPAAQHSLMLLVSKDKVRWERPIITASVVGYLVCIVRAKRLSTVL